MTERAAPEPGPRPEPLWQLVTELLRGLPALIGDRVELAALELRRAFRSFILAIALTVAAAVLGVTAWLGLWFVIVSLLAQAGMLPVLALSLCIAVNLAVAAFALYKARALLRQVALPATYRHLAFARSDKAAVPPPPAAPEPVHAPPTAPLAS